jgi:hypothetical protein
VDVVHDERTLDGDDDGPVALVELPSIDLAGTMAEVDAPVGGEVSRRLRTRMGREVGGRADDHRPQVPRDAHGDHVLLDELAQLDAGIETVGHEAGVTVRRLDLEQHVRIFPRE